MHVPIDGSEKSLADNTFTRWVDRHDDTWLFTIIYVALAVTLSLSISLFWLFIVALAHSGLEWYALSRAGVTGFRSKIKKILWHIRLDLVVILFALWLGVYMTAIFGVLGISAVTRASTAARATTVARATPLHMHDFLNTMSIIIDDIILVLRGFARRSPKEQQASPQAIAVEQVITPLVAPVHPWQQIKGLGLGDKLLFIGAVALLATLMLSPILSPYSSTEVIEILTASLDPWP